MHQHLVFFRFGFVLFSRPDAQGVVGLHASGPTAALPVIGVAGELVVEMKLGLERTPRRLRPDAA